MCNRCLTAPALRNQCTQQGNTPPKLTAIRDACALVFPPLLRALPSADPFGSDGSGEPPAFDKTIKGLPPMAVLAASHGGRLVASAITVAGDRGGGGFNVKAARGAARVAMKQAALAQELAIEEERKARKARPGPRNRVAALAGCPRRPRRGLPSSKHGGDRNRGASSWGRGQHQEGDGKLLRSAATSAAAGGSPRGAGHLSGGGSLAPSFGGAALSSGSVGSGGGASIVDTEASVSAGPSIRELRGGGAADVVRTLRGLKEDSVVWASSMRGSSRSSSSSRNRRRRKEDGAGQVETIQRLVHMGMF